MKKAVLSIVFILFLQLVQAQNFESIKFKTLPQKLGDEINTDEMEGEPKISPDGNMLYFCRRNDANNIGGPDTGADIWFSVKDENGNWLPAKNLGTPVNDRNFNQLIGIRADGNGIMVKGSMDSHTLNDIYISRRLKGKWQKPEPITIEGITKRLTNATYSVSPDFNVLFISTDKLFGIGKDDIYVSFLVAEATYSEPKNIGNVLNTIDEEVFPVLASDNKTLYFSSNGHAGFGDFDIFVSRRKGDSWFDWTLPVNLGNVINSKGFDADFFVDNKAEFAYISSDKDDKGNFDIYRIELPEEARPKPVVLLTGKVFEENLDSAIVLNLAYSDFDSGKALGSTAYPSSDGSYKLVLPYGNKYNLRIEAQGYTPENEIIDLQEIDTYQELNRDFKLFKEVIITNENNTTDTLSKGFNEIELENMVNKLMAEEVIIDSDGNLKPLIEVNLISNISFQFGNAILLAENFPELSNLVTVMQTNPKLNLEISGHTDNVGSEQGNRLISEKRAKAVADYIILQGIAENRITYKGYGESRPVATNRTEEGRQFNRRVEFKISMSR